MKKLVLVGLSALLLVACKPRTTAPTADQTAPEQGTSMQAAWTVNLSEQNGSGQTGTATIEEVDGKVRVMLNMTGETFPDPQPAHIHIGSCPEPGDVVYPLTDVVNNQSETMLEVDLATLQSQSPLAINVHKSAEESAVYTACGDIMTETAPAEEAPAETMQEETSLDDEPVDDK